MTFFAISFFPSYTSSLLHSATYEAEREQADGYIYTHDRRRTQATYNFFSIACSGSVSSSLGGWVDSFSSFPRCSMWWMEGGECGGHVFFSFSFLESADGALAMCLPSYLRIGWMDRSIDQQSRAG